MIDFTANRTMMVDTQIRPSDVTKFPIIDAMLSVKREFFVPEQYRSVAYAGGNIDLGGGRVVLEPRTFAKMLDAVDIKKSELVLDVGCGLGYSSAVMARMCDAVIAVEENSDLAAAAQTALAEQDADNVAVVEGPLHEGAAKHGPYDVITLQGAAGHMPDALLDQLKEGGRIVAVFEDGALGVAKVGYKLDGRVSWRTVFNASAPILPNFEACRAFKL